MLSVQDVIECSKIQSRLPEMEPHDRDWVMAHAVALQMASIPGDAAKERSILENAIVCLAWRIQFCRYVERCIAQCGEPVTYEEWKTTLGK